MSNAACAKKHLCNPPVVAAVETADRNTVLLSNAADSGLITHAQADTLIYKMTDSDERYCKEQKAIGLEVIALFKSVETAERIDFGY